MDGSAGRCEPNSCFGSTAWFLGGSAQDTQHCISVPIYGYARVSTDGQTLDAQIAQLKAAGAEKVFREKVSGARADRPELARLMRTLSAGDVVIVTRLDRLARSTRDLLNTPRVYHRQASRLSFTKRHLGGYDDAPWPLDADRPGGSRRVRA